MSGYTRDLVIQLLPGAWDPSYAYGMANPTAPDPDMPRVAADKSHGNTLYAHLADIKAAWAYSPLSHTQRVTLMLVYGLGWSNVEAGEHQGVSKAAIGLRLDKAVGIMTHWLNGTEDNEGDTE